MGKYFDFTPPKPWATGLGDIFAGANAGLEYRDKRRVQDAEIAQKKASTDAFTEQVKAQNRKIELDEKRAQFKFRQEQADHDAATAKSVTDAAASGSVGRAQALAAASQGVDPITGKSLGVTFKPEDAGPAPEAPVAPDAPAMLPTRQGPDPTGIASMFLGMGGGDRGALTQNPEEARAKAIAKAMGGRTEPPAPGSGEELLAKAAGEEAYGGAERAQKIRGREADNQLQNDINKSTYDRQKAGYDVERAGYEPVKAAHDERTAHPNFQIGVNGQQINYNPDEAKNAKVEEARQQADKLRTQAADPTIPQELRMMLLQTANSVEARLPAAAAGAITNATSQAGAHTFTGAQNDARNQTQRDIGAGHDRAGIRRAEIRGPDKGGGIYPNKDERPVIEEFRHNVADVTRKGGLAEQMHHQETTLKILEEDPENPTNWTNLVDAMIRSATGKAAILNQYVLYTGHAAPSLADAADQLNERLLTSGGLSDAQRKSLYSSAQAAYNETADQWEEARRNAEEYYQDPRVAGSQGVKAGIDRTMHNTFRGGQRTHKTATTVPGRPNVPLSGKQGQAAPPPAAAKPAAAHAPGETKIIYRDGKPITVVKVGPGHWEPQAGPPAP